MKISKTKIVQYFLIYWLLLDLGSLAATYIGSDMYYILSLLFGGIVCLTKYRTKIFNDIFSGYVVLFLIGLLVSMLLSCIVTGGKVLITVILSIVARFVIVFAAVIINRKEFVNRFIRLIFILSIASDIFFIGYFLGGTGFWSFITPFLHTTVRSQVQQGNAYGLFFICLNYFDPTRNSYIFGEPGEYQMVIATAMFFMLFFKNELSKKFTKQALVAFVITMITIQSTTGYFNLIIILLGAFTVKSSKYENYMFLKYVKRATIGLGIVILSYSLIFAGNSENVINKVIFSKIINEYGKVDLTGNTAGARWKGFQNLLIYARSHPINVIFGCGFTERYSSIVESANGFTNSILDIGLINVLWMIVGYCILLFKKCNGNIMVVFVGMFLILNTWFAQPVVHYTLFILIGFSTSFFFEQYSTVRRINNEKYR